MRLYVERLGKRSGSQHLDRQIFLAGQSGRPETLRGNLRARLQLLELADVHWLVLHSKRVIESPAIGQLPHQWQLATLEIRRHTSAAPRLLTLGAGAGRLAASRAPTSTYAPSMPMCSDGRL